MFNSRKVFFLILIWERGLGNKVQKKHYNIKMLPLIPVILISQSDGPWQRVLCQLSSLESVKMDLAAWRGLSTLMMQWQPFEEHNTQDYAVGSVRCGKQLSYLLNRVLRTFSDVSCVMCHVSHVIGPSYNICLQSRPSKCHKHHKQHLFKIFWAGVNLLL